jgi:hypothetical protein
LVENHLSFSPYILHLCQQYGCINKAEQNALTIAENEMVYKLGPEVELTEARTEESSKDHVAPEPRLLDPIHVLAPVPALAHVQKTKRIATSWPRDEGGPTTKHPWRNINPVTWEPPEVFFKRVWAELTNLQNEYWRQEHITRGVGGRWGIVEPEISSVN